MNINEITGVTVKPKHTCDVKHLIDAIQLVDMNDPRCEIIRSAIISKDYCMLGVTMIDILNEYSQ